MKKAKDDVKSFVTILFAIALVGLLYASLVLVFMKGETTIFETVFLLFTNLCTAVFTYFFTRKVNEKNNNEEVK